MNTFRLLNIEGASSGYMKPRVPNVEVEIKRGCSITLEWNEMLGKCVISLEKFKLQEQLCFAAKVNIMHIQR